MIFADLHYKGKYDDFHIPILTHLQEHFIRVDAGLQGDSWIWVFEGKNKVAIDTFSSMTHQVKASSRDNPLIPKVIDVLEQKFDLYLYPVPKLEPHD